MKTSRRALLLVLLTLRFMSGGMARAGEIGAAAFDDDPGRAAYLSGRAYSMGSHLCEADYLIPDSDAEKFSYDPNAINAELARLYFSDPQAHEDINEWLGVIWSGAKSGFHFSLRPSDLRYIMLQREFAMGVRHCAVRHNQDPNRVENDITSRVRFFAGGVSAVAMGATFWGGGIITKKLLAWVVSSRLAVFLIGKISGAEETLAALKLFFSRPHVQYSIFGVVVAGPMAVTIYDLAVAQENQGQIASAFKASITNAAAAAVPTAGAAFDPLAGFQNRQHIYRDIFSDELLASQQLSEGKQDLAIATQLQAQTLLEGQLEDLPEIEKRLGELAARHDMSSTYYQMFSVMQRLLTQRLVELQSEVRVAQSTGHLTPRARLAYLELRDYELLSRAGGVGADYEESADIQDILDRHAQHIDDEALSQLMAHFFEAHPLVAFNGARQ